MLSSRSRHNFSPPADARTAGLASHPAPISERRRRCASGNWLGCNVHDLTCGCCASRSWRKGHVIDLQCRCRESCSCHWCQELNFTGKCFESRSHCWCWNRCTPRLVQVLRSPQAQVLCFPRQRLRLRVLCVVKVGDWLSVALILPPVIIIIIVLIIITILIITINQRPPNGR